MTDLDGLELLRFLWVDNASVIRAKSVPLLGAAVDRADLDRAVRISQAQMAIPVHADAVVAEAGLLPEHDVTLVPDWSTLRRVDERQAAVSCTIHDGDRPWEHCPRSFLRRMEGRAREAGMRIRVGVELEFTLLRDAVPIDGSAYAQDVAYDLDGDIVLDILGSLDRQGLRVAQCHPESGPGQWEISMAHLPVLEAADAIVGVRQTVRAVASRHGLSVTFLPMVTADTAGAGMHAHLSFTGDASDGLGPYGEPFIAGVLSNMPALLAATAPSPLSLLRFRPHFWVGAYLGWGMENKEAPLRVVAGDSTHPRDVEYKAGDATANPYIMLGCLLAAGLDGVRNPAVLPPPLVGDPGLLTDSERVQQGIAAMPTDPAEVLSAFNDSTVFPDAMGDLHTSYCAVRRAEHEQMAGLALEGLIEVMVDRV